MDPPQKLAVSFHLLSGLAKRFRFELNAIAVEILGEPFAGEPVCHITNVIIESAIFVDDDKASFW